MIQRFTTENTLRTSNLVYDVLKLEGYNDKQIKKLMRALVRLDLIKLTSLVMQYGIENFKVKEFIQTKIKDFFTNDK